MKIAEAMIRFRAVNKLTQKDLAEMCGVSTQTISNVESGVQKPSRVTVEKIKIGLGIMKED